jgi:DNA-binding PadR family transcriptional regulator
VHQARRAREASQTGGFRSGANVPEEARDPSGRIVFVDIYSPTIYTCPMSTRALEVRSLILRSLAASNRDASGLIADVGAISGGRVRLRAGTLFAALWRLQADRMVAVVREEVVDRRVRRYYTLTIAGHQRVTQHGKTHTNHTITGGLR